MLWLNERFSARLRGFTNQGRSFHSEWEGMEWRGVGWASAGHHFPWHPESQDQLGDRPQGQGYRESRPGSFPSSQPLGIGTCHRESEKYFTKQWRHVPHSFVLRNSHADPGGGPSPRAVAPQSRLCCCRRLRNPRGFTEPWGLQEGCGESPPRGLQHAAAWGPSWQDGWLYSRSPTVWDLQKGTRRDCNERAPAMPSRLA